MAAAVARAASLPSVSPAAPSRLELHAVEVVFGELVLRPETLAALHVASSAPQQQRSSRAAETHGQQYEPGLSNPATGTTTHAARTTSRDDPATTDSRTLGDTADVTDANRQRGTPTRTNTTHTTDACKPTRTAHVTGGDMEPGTLVLQFRFLDFDAVELRVPPQTLTAARLDVHRGRSCLFPSDASALTQRLQIAPLYIALLLRRAAPKEAVLLGGAAMPLGSAGAGPPRLLRLLDLRGDEVALVTVRCGLRNLGAAALRHFARGANERMSAAQWDPVPAPPPPHAQPAWRHLADTDTDSDGQGNDGSPPPLHFHHEAKARDEGKGRDAVAERWVRDGGRVRQGAAAQVVAEAAAVDRFFTEAAAARAARDASERARAAATAVAHAGVQGRSDNGFELLQALQTQLQALLANVHGALPGPPAPAPRPPSLTLPHSRTEQAPVGLPVSPAVSHPSRRSTSLVDDPDIQADTNPDTQAHRPGDEPPRARWRPSTLEDSVTSEARLAELQARWHRRLARARDPTSRLHRGEPSPAAQAPTSLVPPAFKVSSKLLCDEAFLNIERTAACCAMGHAHSMSSLLLFLLTRACFGIARPHACFRSALFPLLSLFLSPVQQLVLLRPPTYSWLFLCLVFTTVPSSISRLQPVPLGLLLTTGSPSVHCSLLYFGCSLSPAHFGF